VISWAAFTVFVLPIGLGIVAGRLSLREGVDEILEEIGLGYVDRMPNAWDFVMRRRQPSYVRIHLKDTGVVVAGIFANRSFGSLDPRRADI
jgi:hypothetical protein